MHSNNTNLSPRSYTWLKPGWIIIMTLLGPCFFALPFFWNAYGHSLSWGEWVIGFLVGILLGFISLSIANKYRKGITIDPQEDKISYGSKSIAISSIERYCTDCEVHCHEGKVSHNYYIVFYGPFGTWRIGTRSEDQANEIDAFLDTLRR